MANILDDPSVIPNRKAIPYSSTCTCLSIRYPQITWLNSCSDLEHRLFADSVAYFLTATMKPNYVDIVVFEFACSITICCNTDSIRNNVTRSRDFRVKSNMFVLVHRINNSVPIGMFARRCYRLSLITRCPPWKW